MRLKQKLILGGVIFILGGIICIFFSTAVYLALQGEGAAELRNFEYCINSLRENESHLKLFFLLLGGVGLVSLALILTAQKPYQSREITITPDITIPAPAGQGQYGSARFMTDKEKSKAFPSYELTPEKSAVNIMLKNGKKLYEAVKNGEIIEDFKPVKSGLFKSGGLVVNHEKINETEKIYVIDEDCNSLIIGKTRCGKTRSLVIPSVCSMALAGEGFVINDPKAYIMIRTVKSVILKKVGFGAA